jgi:hypothetical protein
MIDRNLLAVGPNSVASRGLLGQTQATPGEFSWEILRDTPPDPNAPQQVAPMQMPQQVYAPASPFGNLRSTMPGKRRDRNLLAVGPNSVASRGLLGQTQATPSAFSWEEFMKILNGTPQDPNAPQQVAPMQMPQQVYAPASPFGNLIA